MTCREIRHTALGKGKRMVHCFIVDLQDYISVLVFGGCDWIGRSRTTTTMSVIITVPLAETFGFAGLRYSSNWAHVAACRWPKMGLSEEENKEMKRPCR